MPALTQLPLFKGYENSPAPRIACQYLHQKSCKYGYPLNLQSHPKMVTCYSIKAGAMVECCFRDAPRIFLLSARDFTSYDYLLGDILTDIDRTVLCSVLQFRVFYLRYPSNRSVFN